MKIPVAGRLDVKCVGSPESLVGLRNLLIHRYWNVEDERVYESVKKGLKDFEDFITHIRKFLERSGKIA